jgi:hypothetical protein
MKNYAYMIFLTILSHFLTSSIQTETSTSRSVTHPQSAPGLARLTSELGHPSSKCSGPSTLNFRVPFAWVIPTLVIAYWYYYPFNPYKAYVC